MITVDHTISRLFWVVDAPDMNEEIFENRQDADEYVKSNFSKQDPYRIYIAEVRNFYQEDNGFYNYDDQADTFTPIITIVTQTDTRPKNQ